MVELKLIYNKVGRNIFRHVLFNKPFFYDFSHIHSTNNDLNGRYQKKYITTYIDESLIRHPYLDKVFQGFLKYVFAWFSIVDDYLE